MPRRRRRAELERQQADILAKATARAEAMNGLVVTITQKAGAEGKLYGSVGTVDISEAVAAKGIELARQEIRLPEGPFRNIGEFDVDINLHTDVKVTIKINIVPEE